VKSAKLDEMERGWFVGAFTPSAHSTDACEVGVKHYKASDREAMHKHLVATEITVVLYGTLRMAGKEWQAGDIIVMEPGEVTDFEAVTDCATVVVKVPGALGDKYLV
jgi:quercetin dioxygenase-like cupin family protein